MFISDHSRLKFIDHRYVSQMDSNNFGVKFMENKKNYEDCCEDIRGYFFWSKYRPPKKKREMK